MISILQGDVLDKLAELPDCSVHTCITSPPYWGLRDYGVAGQIGLEKTPEEYIAKMVAVFGEVKRVLREDGTLWLNLGDSYAASGGAHKEHHANPGISNSFIRTGVPHFGDLGQPGNYLAPDGLKPKDLVGIPWRVALALQADGWWLRSDIIWAKPNPMPESVTDRPTKSHEYIFLLTKSQRYYYDAEAVKETATTAPHTIGNTQRKLSGRNSNENVTESTGRNLRSVWTITTKGYAEAHFATFPPEIPERCIKAGTSEKGVCSKCGAGWVRVITKNGEAPESWHGSKFDDGKNLEVHPTVGRRENATTSTQYAKGTTANRLALLRQQARENGGEYSNGSKTLGWSPACTCNADVIPATVLDCFGGSGTTGQVAENLGRNAILIELNPKYIPLIKKRTHHTNLFTA